MRTFSTFLKTLLFVFYLLMLYSNIEISFINVLVCVLALVFSNTIHAILHELGHFIGGIISGYRLLQLRLGPIILSKTQQGKCELNFCFSKFNQCVMIPQRSQKYIAYNLFGVIFNTLTTAIVMCLYFFNLKSLSDIGIIIFLSLLVIGINKIISNALPIINNGYPNDMKIISLISKSELVKKHYFMYLSAFEKVFYNLPLDSIRIEEIKQEIDSNTDSFFAEQIIKLYEC